ncbi:unnamed protein product [Malus baccata var. baccata]
MAVRSLIKRLLVYGKERRQEKKLLDREEQEWQVGASTSQDESNEESCQKELERAIQMAECIYDLDEPDDFPESPKLVEFLCIEPDKPPPEVQDPLEVIELGTKEDPRPIQISGLLERDDRVQIICLLQEFRDCFAWHYTEMPGLDATLVEHKMPIKEGYKPVKQAPRRMSKEIEEKVKEEIERLVKAGFIKPAKYVEWLANIVPVLKVLTKAVRCCVDYRNINGATPKDEYPMPMADLSIDAVAKHKVLSFMDGNVGYNQIKMAPEDTHKTTFRCPWHVGAYEYLVIPFGLKNASATYQRAMNAIFHDLIGHNMEVYIDDMMVKSKMEEQHLIDLRQALTRMRTHRLKMNPKKCAFGDKENFEWGPPHQEAFDGIKAYLTSPPVLVPPQRGKPLKLYISASDKSIGSLLAQNNEGGKEQAVYYLSRILTEYVPQRAVKGQAIADFLTEHQESRDEKASGAGIVIINPQGIYHYYSFLLDYQGNTNNWAEYEALRIGLEILMDLGAMEVEVFGDSELVINQLNGEFKCIHITMAGYYLVATQLLSYWDSEILVSHVPRGANLAANEMAQLASGMPIQERRCGLDVEIQRRNLPSILERGFSLDVIVQETEIEDWRSPIIHHLNDLSSPTSKKNRQQATKYVLWMKYLLRKTPDGLLLKCLGQEESMRVMAEVHEGYMEHIRRGQR